MYDADAPVLTGIPGFSAGEELEVPLVEGRSSGGPVELTPLSPPALQAAFQAKRLQRQRIL